MRVRFGRLRAGRKNADAVGCLTVEIPIGGQPVLLGGFHPGAAGGILIAQGGDGQFAVAPVVTVFAACKCFQSAEMRQDVLIGPALGAEGLPIIKIFVLAPDIDQTIDGARPADNPAARPGDAAMAISLGRFGFEHPRKARIIYRLEIADGQLQPEIAVMAARFQQQHPAVGIGRQPIGDNAAGGA